MAVTLKEAIQILESGAWIEPLRFITCDVNKGTGGKVIEIPKCKIARSQNNSVQRSAASHSPSPSERVGVRFSKNPNHNYNFTRNIELPNKLIRKVHPLLITHINNQAVI